MSEPTIDDVYQTDTPADPDADVQQADTSAEELTPDDDPRDSRREAKFRKQLRSVEAERDTIAGRLEAMQRGEAERLAASKLADPQDLWRDGAQLSDVVDDAGRIDPDKLGGLIGTVLEAHKHWARQSHPAAAPASEVTANGKIEGGGSPQPTWTDVLQGRVETE